MEALIIMPVVSIVACALFIYYVTRYINNDPAMFEETNASKFYRVIDSIEASESFTQLGIASNNAKEATKHWEYDPETMHYLETINSKIDERTCYLNRKEYFSLN